MSELEHHEPYVFGWGEDAEGEFLQFLVNGEHLQMRKTNSIMYLFPDQPEYDHVFVVKLQTKSDWLQLQTTKLN